MLDTTTLSSVTSETGLISLLHYNSCKFQYHSEFPTFCLLYVKMSTVNITLFTTLTKKHRPIQKAENRCKKLYPIDMSFVCAPSIFFVPQVTTDKLHKTGFQRRKFQQVMQMSAFFVFLSLLFNDAVTCYDYTPSVRDQ